jgi:hypothetical protein
MTMGKPPFPQGGKGELPILQVVRRGWGATLRPASAQVPIPASVRGHADVALQVGRQVGRADGPVTPPLEQRDRQRQNDAQGPVKCDQRLQGLGGPQGGGRCVVCHDMYPPAARTGSDWVL